MIGPLRQRANEEYDALPDNAHRATMQRVMLRMISAETGELARRRVTLSELEYPTAEENQRVNTVLERLVQARLLVRGKTDVGEGRLPDRTLNRPTTRWWRPGIGCCKWKREAEEYLPLCSSGPRRRRWNGPAHQRRKRRACSGTTTRGCRSSSGLWRRLARS